MRKKIRNILFASSIILLVVSFITYQSENKDKKIVENKMENLVENVIKKKNVDKKELNTDGNMENHTISKKEKLVIDWQFLHSINPDIIGWIEIPNTPINYPILQGDDNKFYERRMYDRSENIFGSIFMDYRVEGFNATKNSIIYGHNTFNDTMFASITKYTKSNFMYQHPYIYIHTPKKEYKFKVFLAYTEDYNSSIYQINMESIIDYVNERKNPEKKLEYKFNKNVRMNENSHIITLSTCSFINTYNHPKERTIVHALLIP